MNATRAVTGRCPCSVSAQTPEYFLCFVQHGAVLKIFARSFRIKKVSSPREKV